MNKQAALYKLATVKLAINHVLRNRLVKRASMDIDTDLLNQYLTAMSHIDPGHIVQYKPTTPRSDDIFQAANDLESALGRNWENLTPKQRAEITALRGALEWYYETGHKPKLDNTYAGLE